jgi:hypothetical protein
MGIADDPSLSGCRRYLNRSPVRLPPMALSRCALSDGFRLFALSEIPTSLFVYLQGAQRLPQAGQGQGDRAQGTFVF